MTKNRDNYEVTELDPKRVDMEMEETKKRANLTREGLVETRKINHLYRGKICITMLKVDIWGLFRKGQYVLYKLYNLVGYMRLFIHLANALK